MLNRDIKIGRPLDVYIVVNYGWNYIIQLSVVIPLIKMGKRKKNFHSLPICFINSLFSKLIKYLLNESTVNFKKYYKYTSFHFRNCDWYWIFSLASGIPENVNEFLLGVVRIINSWYMQIFRIPHGNWNFLFYLLSVCWTNTLTFRTGKSVSNPLTLIKQGILFRREITDKINKLFVQTLEQPYRGVRKRYQYTTGAWESFWFIVY